MPPYIALDRPNYPHWVDMGGNSKGIICIIFSQHIGVSVSWWSVSTAQKLQKILAYTLDYGVVFWYNIFMKKQKRRSSVLVQVSNEFSGDRMIVKLRTRCKFDVGDWVYIDSGGKPRRWHSELGFQWFGVVVR